MTGRDLADTKAQVEMVEALGQKDTDIANNGDGTINLFRDGAIVLVPTPNADPKGTQAHYHYPWP